VASTENMAYINEVNYQDTIRKKAIVFKSKWFDLIDSFLFIVMSCFFIVCLILIYREADLNSPNDSFVAYWILPFAMVFTLFSLYKKIREKRLLIIETNLNKIEARKEIVHIVESWGWKIYRNNANYLQATTGMGLADWGKQVIIIYADKKLFVNVMSDNPKIRMPVLFSDKSIKKDIERQITASH
jgi:uncharacterized membrane protein YbhN (UPF0104 family)